MLSIKIDIDFGDGDRTEFEATNQTQPVALLGVLMQAARRILEFVLGYEPEVELKIKDKNLTPQDVVK